MTAQKKSPLVIIFLTIFIYLLGFGIIIPIVPVLGRDFGATPLQIGLLMSVYSITQFVFAPMWGQISDRVGRRPVLLGCLVGEGLSYLLFAWARSLELLFVARIFAGFFAASLSTASAFISDVTPVHERSKGMALFGAAFGLGFAMGPAIGAGLSWWGDTISKSPFFATSFTSTWVAGLCLSAFVFAYFNLPESLLNKNTHQRLRRLQRIFEYAKRPVVGPLLSVYFLIAVSMSAMEATLILLVGDRFGWGLEQVYIAFSVFGILLAFNQGYLARRILPVFGERKLLLAGGICMVIALTGIAYSDSVIALAASMLIFSIGYSISNPSVTGSISALSNANEQGSVFGVTQSLASLGRVTGPALGGYLYGKAGIASPYLAGALLSLIAVGISARFFNQLPESAKLKKSHGV